MKLMNHIFLDCWVAEKTTKGSSRNNSLISALITDSEFGDVHEDHEPY